jgi:GntR family transcriptional repressor for pyruvate dehydrogenase complex
MDNDLFTILKREESLSDRVANQIQDLITSNKLAPGDKLPSERELAEKFGVSRTVIRESMRSLKAKGLVDIQQGSGVVVTAVNPEQISESIALFLSQVPENIEYRHLAELRKIVEIEFSGLAAQRATEEDIKRMEREIQRMEAVRDSIATDNYDRQEFARADVNFHLAVAVATKNPLLPIIFKPLVDSLVTQRMQAFDRPGALEQGMLYHKDIFEAIKNNDEKSAREAMREHLEKSLIIMETVLENNEEIS